jgi:hypothetical protein
MLRKVFGLQTERVNRRLGKFYYKGLRDLAVWEPHPPGIVRACPGLYRDCLTLTFYRLFHNKCIYSLIMKTLITVKYN